MKKAKEQLKIRKSNQLSTEVRSKAEEVRPASFACSVRDVDSGAELSAHTPTLGACLELVIHVPVTSVRECECEMTIYVCGLVVP